MKPLRRNVFSVVPILPLVVGSCALTALVGCAIPADVAEQGTQAEISAPGPVITPDVVYGHKVGMALTFDVYQPQERNGAGVVFIVSGGWLSRWEWRQYEAAARGGWRVKTDDELGAMQFGIGTHLGISYKPLLAQGFTVFALRHGGRDRFGMSEIVDDVRRGMRFIGRHASDYGVDPDRLGVWGGSAGGHLALLLGTTGGGERGEAGDIADVVPDVAAVVAYFPVSDLERHAVYSKDVREQLNPVLAPLDKEAFTAYSPVRHVTSDDAPTLIVHGDADDVVRILEGETMYRALERQLVDTRFVSIPGAGHGFVEGASNQAHHETVQWFQQHLVGEE